MGTKKYNPNRVGNALRPIIREQDTVDVAARIDFAVHQQSLQAVPGAHPGALITQPDIAGSQVKGQLGGGFFNPLRKTSKFK